MMILILIFFSFNFFTKVSVANESRKENINILEKCFKITKKANRKHPLPSYCYDNLLSLKNNDKSDFGEEKSAFALKNLIAIKTPKRINYISGNMSQLNDVISISLNYDESLVAVMDSDYGVQTLLIFDATMSGNIAPIATMKLKESRHFVFSKKDNILYGLNNSNIEVFRLRQHKITKTSIHNLPKELNITHMTTTKNELVVFDFNNKVLLGAKLDPIDNKFNWEWKYSLYNMIKSIERLLYDTKTRHFIIYFKDKTNMKLKHVN